MIATMPRGLGLATPSYSMKIQLGAHLPPQHRLLTSLTMLSTSRQMTQLLYTLHTKLVGPCGCKEMGGSTTTDSCIFPHESITRGHWSTWKLLSNTPLHERKRDICRLRLPFWSHSACQLPHTPIKMDEALEIGINT